MIFANTHSKYLFQEDLTFYLGRSLDQNVYFLSMCCRTIGRSIAVTSSAHISQKTDIGTVYILWLGAFKSLSNLTFLQILWLFLLFWFTLSHLEAELRVLWVQHKRSVILVFTVAKNVHFKLNGDEFFMTSISKIMVPL